MKKQDFPSFSPSLLKKKYRACLLESGKSPDYHIYDLSYRFIQSIRKRSCRIFLLEIKRYYDGLGKKDQSIFLREVLEAKRHYPFWFLGAGFRRGEYEMRKKKIMGQFGAV